MESRFARWCGQTTRVFSKAVWRDARRRRKAVEANPRSTEQAIRAFTSGCTGSELRHRARQEVMRERPQRTERPTKTKDDDLVGGFNLPRSLS